MNAIRIPDPWTALPPAYGPHLPGGIVPLTVRMDRSMHEVPWRGVRHLHAAITHAFNRQHHATLPDFSLVPTRLSPSGWAMHLRDLPVAQVVAGATVETMLGERPVTITCGAVTRWRTPAVEATGRHRVVLTAETPVVIRYAGGGAVGRGDAKQVYLYPVEHALVGSLTNALAERLGLEVSAADVALRILATETEQVATVVGHLNGHGVVRGWAGRMVMDVSPLARWLLDCAARLGLGGRTAFGFGRVQVRDMAISAPLHGKPYPVDGLPEDRVGAQAIRAWTKLTGAPTDGAVRAIEALLAGAKFERIADNGVWIWRNGRTLLFVERSATGRPRVCALGAVSGSEEERQLARIGATDPPDEDAPDDSATPPRFVLSDKAIERYRERIEPHLSPRQAAQRLRALTDAGRLIGPYRGEHLGALPRAELWRGPHTGTGNNRVRLANDRIRFVVADGDDGRRTVITVLPRRGHGLDSGARVDTVRR